MLFWPKMSFRLSKKSKKSLNRFAKIFLNDRESIRETAKGRYSIWGSDPVTGTHASASVWVNKRGKITHLLASHSGPDEFASRKDNQFMVFNVKKANKAIKWFEKSIYGEYGSLYLSGDFNKKLARQAAEVFDYYLPGLKGGTTDVYVALGDNTIFS